MGWRGRKHRLDGAGKRRNPVRWLIATGVVLLGAIILAATLTIISFRDSALESHRREQENRLVLLTRHYEHEFSDLDRVQRDISIHLQLAGVVTREQFTEHMSTTEEHIRLKAKLNSKASSTLNILDAEGWLINSTQGRPAVHVNFGDRKYFQQLKDAGGDPSEEVSELILSPISDQRRLLFARRLMGPNGEFLGVVTRHVPPEQFQAFFATVSPSQDSTIALWNETFTLLARFPHMNDMIGKSFTPDVALSRIETSVEPSTLIHTGIIDGRERMSSIQRIPGFPLAIVASTPLDRVLVDWYALRRVTVIAALLAALLVVGVLYLVIGQVRQQNQLSRAQLKLERERLRKAINNMTQGLLMFDADARAVIVNQSYLDMYHLPRDTIWQGMPLREALAHHRINGACEGEDLDTLSMKVLETVKTRHTRTISLNDGRVIHLQCQPITDGGWVVTHEDITERHRVEERIAHLAHYDTLTDLPNRALFQEMLSQELGWISRGQQCAVIYVDMDEFKSINDSLGHSVGDALLTEVAKRLKGCVRNTDVVARLGGDEFAIVRTDLKNRDELVDLMERIHTAIREPFECLGHRLLTDASMGVALAPQDGSDLDQLLRNADLAMYSAKADGRRTYRFFEPEMDARVQSRRALEHDLRDAIAGGDLTSGGFEVYYQPLLKLADDSVSGCEALLRWRHPRRGVVSPADFIPVAEEIGVINQLGEWVLTTACKEAAGWPQDIKLAVNVSPVQFRSHTLSIKVAAALAASGLAPARLELEITEAVLIRDDEVALTVLHGLRAIGVRIALDDFGTGYSSLSYLQRFPFDKIKIDRCFVTEIAEPNGSSSIVQPVVTIASSRNMITTAEGVETQAQKELLRTLGCTEIQGWLFSAAKPAAEIRALIEAHDAKTRAA